MGRGVGDEGEMKKIKIAFAAVLFFGHVFGAAWSEPNLATDAIDTEKSAQAKKEIQSYIDLVGKNDREDREDAYAKPQRTEKTPGWKSR